MYLGFRFLAMMNNAVMNILIKVLCFSSLVYIVRNGIAGSYGNPVNLLRECQAVSFSSQICQHLSLSIIFYFSHPCVVASHCNFFDLHFPND